MGNIQCAADGASLPHNLTSCGADTAEVPSYAGRSGQGFVKPKNNRRQRLSAAAKNFRRKNKENADLGSLNIDVNVSPEKYVSNNLNAQTALSAAALSVNDENSVMEKVLAENRRLQLLCDKMRKDNHSQPTATALDFFSLDESQLDEPRTLDLTVEGEEVALQMGHKLFVDGILGVSSEFMNKGMNKGNINPTSMFSKHTDPESGKLYYYNKETGKSIWAKEWKKKKMPR